MLEAHPRFVGGAWGTVTGATVHSVGELLAVFDLVGEAHERVADTATQRIDLVGMGVLWVDAGERGSAREPFSCI